MADYNKEKETMRSLLVLVVLLAGCGEVTIPPPKYARDTWVVPNNNMGPMFVHDINAWRGGKWTYILRAAWRSNNYQVYGEDRISHTLDFSPELKQDENECGDEPDVCPHCSTRIKFNYE